MPGLLLASWVVVDITSCCQHRALLLGPRAIAGIVGVIVDITHVMLALWAFDITLYCWHCIVDIVDYCWHRGLLLASRVIAGIADYCYSHGLFLAPWVVAGLALVLTIEVVGY